MPMAFLEYDLFSVSQATPVGKVNHQQADNLPALRLVQHMQCWPEGFQTWLGSKHFIARSIVRVGWCGKEPARGEDRVCGALACFSRLAL